MSYKVKIAISSFKLIINRNKWLCHSFVGIGLINKKRT